MSHMGNDDDDLGLDLDPASPDAEQHPFLPIDPASGRPHRSRHARTHSATLSHRRGRLRAIVLNPLHALRAQDRRTHVLLALTLVAALLSTLYFWFPSTLHLYLALVCVTLPVSLVFDLCSYALDRGNSWSRARTVWFLLCLCIGAAVLLPTLLLPAPPLYNAPPALVPGAEPLPAFPKNDVYYFAMNLYNSAPLFPTFADSLLALVSALGPANVFVSIYESNSKDNTKLLLSQLEGELTRIGVQSRIKMDMVGKDQRHDKEEWSTLNTRIDYLSRVRNEALRPLDRGMTGLGGRNFTRIVWMNDIYYDWKAVLELFNTHNGEFDLACAFDYIPLGFYDTWVTRDLCGDGVKPLWPYFNHADDIEFLKHGLPIPVNSCWNGIAAFDAQYYLGSGNGTTIYPDSPLPLRLDGPTDPDHTNYTLAPPTLPLRFRYDSACVASECLLAAFDIHRLLHTSPTDDDSPSPPAKPPQTPPSSSPSSQRQPHPQSQSQSQPPSSPARTLIRRPRIYMNPRVVTTYDRASFYMYQHLMRWHLTQPWRFLWRDLFAHRLFGWVSNVGRRVAVCREAFRNGWAAPPDSRFCPAR